MDQLTAYEILGLAQGATQEEIKEAYATLCKIYHPEESPEEFQRINEAYRALTQRSRRHNNRSASETQNEIKDPFVKPEKPQVKAFDFDNVRMEQKEQTQEDDGLNFDNIRMERKNEESEDSSEYDFDNIRMERADKGQQSTYNFDEAMYRAEQEKIAYLRGVAQQAIEEMKVLLFTSKKEKVKLFEAFFKKEEYQPILRTALFTEALAALLTQAKVKQLVYACIAKYYRLENANPATVGAELKSLTLVLNAKIKKKDLRMNAGLGGGLVAGIVTGLRYGLKRIARENEIVRCLVILFTEVVLLYLLYKFLYKNHSSIFAQGVVASVLCVLQFLLLGFEGTSIYGNVEMGDMIATFLFLGSLAWLAILIIVALIKKVISLGAKTKY